MRVLGLFLLIPLVAALAAGLWGLAIMKGDVRAFIAVIERGEFPDWPEVGGYGVGYGGTVDDDFGNRFDTTGDLALNSAATADDAQGGAQGQDEFRALTVQYLQRARLGPGDSWGGLTIERADADFAVALLETGQRVTISATDGYAPQPRFSNPEGGHIGVLLTHESAPPIGMILTDIAQMRTAKLPEKIAFYKSLAEQLDGPQSNGMVIDDASHDGRGVFFCMRPRSSNTALLTGARIDRGVLVAAVLRLGCGDATDADIARLEVAVRAVTPERWR